MKGIESATENQRATEISQSNKFQGRGASTEGGDLDHKLKEEILEERRRKRVFGDSIKPEN